MVVGANSDNQVDESGWSFRPASRQRPQPSRDGELVSPTRDGRADFDLLSARLLRAFDRIGAGMYWGLDLERKTEGSVRLTIYSTDGVAMHRATAEAGAEGTVSKRRAAAYRPGRSRFGVKVKHSVTGTFDVQG